MKDDQKELKTILERHEIWLEVFYASIDSSLMADAPIPAFYGAVHEADQKMPNYRANFAGADLRDADLSDARLMLARLSKADLSGAKFLKADLLNADLRGAILRKADFSGARLAEADLSSADLTGARFERARLQDLQEAILDGANLTDASLAGVDLVGAKLRESDLSKADLRDARLRGADLRGAILTGADLSGADLTGANLEGANLQEAILERATLIQAGLRKADLRGARVYGISVWDVETDEETRQSNLYILKSSKYGRPPATVRVDNLEVAQFIYLLLDRQKLRHVFNTITSKAVLILGRFTPERKAVLEALTNEVRKHDLLPIIFDFDRPEDRDFTETVKILAGLCLFVIADITNPKSAPLELQATVPDYQIPFVPIIEEGEKPFSMFRDLRGKYHWVLTPVTYKSISVLQQVFRVAILNRAWDKHKELQRLKMEEEGMLSAESFLKSD